MRFLARILPVYEDILGRQFKTESYNWDGSTVYSTVVNSYNGRDQAVLTRQYAGSTTSSTYQDTTASFDGHGRLSSTHKPEQRDASNNLTYTTYSYNPDDSIHTVTDGRGAVTTYTYGYQDDSSSTEKRALLTKVAYSVPTGSGITDPSDVTYTYDNLGNRTQMTDGMGNTVYSYDSLSEMTSETRQFNDTLANAPMSSNRFQISYAYGISGQLKSYTDPYGQQISYARDQLGRLSSITGSSFAGVTTYANQPSYRAWGMLKHLDYGSGFQLDATYNNRLLPNEYKIDNPNDSDAPLYDATYSYYKDGKSSLFDNSATGYSTFDRSFTYDSMGRIKDAKSGIEAHGQTQTTLSQLPYRQSYSFDPFGNPTNRTSTLWTNTDWSYSYSYTNNRTGPASNYDKDGNQIAGEVAAEYDATGAMSRTTDQITYETLLAHDGDGAEVKRSQRIIDPVTEDWGDWKNRYFIFSSVMGQVLTEADSTGKKRRTYVLADGATVARQGIDEGTTTEVVGWEYREPSGHSKRTTTSTSGSSVETNSEAELDGIGTNVGLMNFQGSVHKSNSISGADPVPFNQMNEPWTEQDGIMLPASMVSKWALAAEGLYYSDKVGFAYFKFQPNFDLPGQPARFSIPETITGRFVPDTGGNVRYFEENGNLSPNDQGVTRYRWETTGVTQTSTVGLDLEFENSRTDCNTVNVVLSNGSNSVSKLSDDELSQMKAEMSRIYEPVGIKLNFVHTEGDFTLSIRSPANRYTNKANAVGETILSADRKTVTSDGYVYPDRLLESAQSTVTGRLLVDLIRSYSPLAIGLGRAGAHELGHFLLQQTDDSSNYFGVMHDGFHGGQWIGGGYLILGIWAFSDDQKSAIRRVVKELRGCIPERISNRRLASDY